MPHIAILLIFIKSYTAFLRKIPYGNGHNPLIASGADVSCHGKKFT